MAILEVEHIKKKFGKTDVLKDISFSLEQGEVLSIIGSSGSGKTTLLRCLNFLEMPDNGIIRVNNEILLDTDKPETLKESEVRKKRLHFGLVFQSFNLFPQYTALQNVMLARELLAKERPDYKANKKNILDEIRVQGEDLLEALEKADMTADDIDYFVLHQANVRIIESVAKRLKAPIEKFPMTLGYTFTLSNLFRLSFEPLRISLRPISICQLNALPHLHLRPINLVVFKGSYFFKEWDI